MAGGNDGNLCNIPAIFIDSLSGSLIANAMINGTVVANIGANPGTNVTTNLNLTIPTSSSIDNINYCETFGAGGNPIPFTWIDGSNHLCFYKWTNICFNKFRFGFVIAL